MTEGGSSRRQAWTPPPRPDWVAKVNEEGVLLDLRGVVPLDEDSLVRTAVANTGLSDFGEDGWRDFLRLYLKSLDEEAELNLMGRLMTRSDILMFLEARLRVEETYKQHPEIADEVVDRPFWIFGLGRSGTSLLQTLLALDPASRTTRVWEAMFPVPLSMEGPDRRRELAEGRITQWNRVTPEIVAMHEFAAEAQTETIHFEAISFRTPAWLNLLGLTPSFNAYCAGQGIAPSLDYARRIFKLLQWRQPKRQWVFKSPDSLGYLPTVLEVFPDARLVWAHRDPIKTMSSAVNLVGTLTWIRSDRRLAAGVYEQITEPAAVAAALSRPIDWLETGVIPKRQLCSIQYADLMEDPIATVGRIYEWYGLDFSAAARRAVVGYLEAHPRSERPAHRYATGHLDQIRAERSAVRRYQDYFSVPDEL